MITARRNSAGTFAPTLDDDRPFFGHPRGLGLLAFAEGCSAFSFYGMSALLVLYLAHDLLLPGHVEHVSGFAWFHRLIEPLLGSLSVVATATAITGLFASLSNITPLIGSVVADRWLGRTRAVAIGALLMTLGHFFMSFYATLLIALLLILIGAGLFNSSLRAQIGDLYAAGDTRIADAFRLYLIVVNVTGTIAPLACGWLAVHAGYGYGFMLAGIGMALGLVGYLAGARWLPAEPPPIRRTPDAPSAGLTRTERWTVLLLVVLIGPIGLAFVVSQQYFNAYLLWGEAHYRLTLFGMAIPVTWLLSLAGVDTTMMLFLSVIFWRWYDGRFGVVSELTRMVVGAGLFALGPLVLIVATGLAEPGGRVGLGWALAYDLVVTIAFATIWPASMALYARAAPRRFSATLMSALYLSGSLGSALAGWLGGFVDRLPSAAFWGLHSALAGLAAVILLIVRQFANQLLMPVPVTGEPDPPSGRGDNA